MLKRLTSISEYMDFIYEVNGDPDFHDPMLSSLEQIRRNLLEAPNCPEDRIWGVFEEQKMTGLFVFLELEEESYLEMLVGLSRSVKAYEEILSFLKETYQGWQADFVYNPKNSLLHRLLLEEGAECYAEQQKMVLEKDVFYQSGRQTTLYDPQYREQYCSLHTDDGYWTAEKVINALDRFRVILALEEDEVVGYLDITHSFDENEPYDMFVKEEYRKKGYAKAMLARAVELNKPKRMVMLIDADNEAAIALSRSLGFVQAAGENSRTAHLTLKLS